MKIVVLGLSLSSSWGNGHATTYRALLAGLGARHDILFLERDQPWYAAHRDLAEPDFCTLEFYRDPAELARYRGAIETADVVMVGSYVPDGVAVAALVRRWVRGVFCFYDIDTPVTLRKLEAGETDYLAPAAIPGFDIYFSFTGGPLLERLRRDHGARRAVPLYCAVDEARYRPMDVETRWDLGYLGTYSADRQPALERLLLEPARRAPWLRFAVAGALYPPDIAWPVNVERFEHLPPGEHARFYNAQRWTLNLTRADMIAAGYSPSVRLFEATACGTPVISDDWPGLETIFDPGRDIVVAHDAGEVIETLSMTHAERGRIAALGRVRCLAEHTARHRALEFEAAIALAETVKADDLTGICT